MSRTWKLCLARCSSIASLAIQEVPIIVPTSPQSSSNTGEKNKETENQSRFKYFSAYFLLLVLLLVPGLLLLFSNVSECTVTF